GGCGFCFEPRGNRHDHAGLAIAALRHVVLNPGLLHLVQRAVLGKPLDGGDMFAFNRAHRHRARSHGRSVDVNGAGTALGNTAAVFRAGEANLLPQHPEQRSARVDINVVGLSVDAEMSHSQPPGDRLLEWARRCPWAGLRAARSITWFHSNVEVAKSRGPPREFRSPAKVAAIESSTRQRTSFAWVGLTISCAPGVRSGDPAK